MNNRNLRRAIYAITFVYTTNFALTLYVNSSFLGGFLSPQMVSVLFSIASLVAMLSLLCTTHLYARIGQHRVTQWFLLINMLGAAVLATTTTIWFILPFWVLFYCTGVLLRFDLDIYMEKVTNNEDTGTVRGIFLTVLNFAIFVSPFIAGRIVGDGNNYTLIYFTASGIAVITLLLATTTLRGIKTVQYRARPLITSFKSTLRNSDLRNIIATTFILEFFYSWMVIYNPLYLHEYIGFDWGTIGIILSIMLLPFVLIQYPLGRIADTWLGEKEILITGFIILAITTGSISFISIPSIALFAGVLLLSRIGAAAVEIMNETYFFKKVDAKDADIISLLRITRPLAFIIGPLLGALILYVIPFNMLFLVLGGIMLTGIFFAIRLVDTR
ncbi:MAG: MFS transporter [bacterium]|nr:MFS transporter [bacterium]